MYGTTYNQPSGSESATDATATVTVSWTSRGPAPGNSYVRGATIDLKDGGRTLLDDTLSAPSPVNDSQQSEFSDGWEAVVPVCVEIPSSGLPIVYVTGYAGAMTCCTVERVYYSLENGSYAAAVDRDMGGTATVEKVGDDVVIEGANRDFSGRFDCVACSGEPIQILEFESDQYVDVTKQFPAQISSDAQKWWNLYESHPDDPLGVLSAWAADECEVGQQSEAFSTLDQMAAAGTLSPPPGSPPTTYSFGLTGSSYVQALQGFLRQEAYC